MKLSIIIPIYNEERYIEKVLEQIEAVQFDYDIEKEIVIIDDASDDSTKNILEKYKSNNCIKIYYNKIREGKTKAIVKGLQNVTGDMILIQDADLEYFPGDYPQLIEPIITNKAAVVYGSRFKGKIEKMPLINRIANILSNITLNFLYHTHITDVHTCYKVFKKDALNGIKIKSKGFVFDTEITAKLLKSGYKIYEVPIKYVARSRKEGKKITWLEALKVYCGIIRYRFKN